MGPKHASCTLSVAALVQIMRGTILSLDGEQWLNSDMAQVAEAYSAFLIACIGATNRLTASLVSSAAAELFGKAHDLKSFGHRLSACFSWGVDRARKAKTGDRWASQGSPELLRVLRAFGMASGSSPTKPSPGGKSPGGPAKQGASSSSSSKQANQQQQQEAAGSSSSSSKPKPQQQHEQPASKQQPEPSVGQKRKGLALANNPEAIYQAYGLSPPTKKKQEAEEPVPVEAEESVEVEAEKPVEVLSSQDSGVVVVHVPEPLTQHEAQPVHEVGSVDPTKNEFALLLPDGTEKRAPLVAGPAGFCQARLEGKVYETEVPNLFLQPETPKAPRKKPAAAKKSQKGKKGKKSQKGKVYEAEDGEDGEEEEKEEEGEQEEGEEEGEEEEEKEEQKEAPKTQHQVSRATGKTYIQSRLPGEKWRLVVMVSQGQSANHLEIGEKILAEIREKGLSKEQALLLRAALLRQSR